MTRIELHSRVGSAALTAVGALYFILALVLFVYFVIFAWNAASALDHFLQLSLLGSAIGGAYLFVVGAAGLRLLPLRS